MIAPLPARCLRAQVFLVRAAAFCVFLNVFLSMFGQRFPRRTCHIRDISTIGKQAHACAKEGAGALGPKGDKVQAHS
jgi:hypothetical protein